jgi:D-arabinose 1-dehydrogenase-like Zn-dependent alcohol dehydrogenase
LAQWQKVLAANGKVVSFSPGVGYIARNLLQTATFSRQSLIPMLLKENSKDLQTLVDLVAEKKLRTVVESKFLLSDVKKAWKKSITGHAVEKIIITPIQR